MVDSFAMFLAIQKDTFVFIFVCIGNLPFVGCSVINPFSIIDRAICILEYSVTILSIFDPISDKFITVFVEIGAFAVFLTVKPVSLVFLSIIVSVNSESMLAIFEPLALEDCSSAVEVGSLAVFFTI